MQLVHGSIKVFKLAADKLMEDLNTVPPLTKTIEFPSILQMSLSCNGLFIGCHHKNSHLDLWSKVHEHFVTVFEKTALLDEATPPEKTERNRIHLGNNNGCLVDMNTTSLLYIKTVPGRESQSQLCKKDFWVLKDFWEPDSSSTP